MAVVEDMIPGAHIATVYAKPEGLSNVDTFVTEVSQDTWIYFPWDTDIIFTTYKSRWRLDDVFNYELDGGIGRQET